VFGESPPWHDGRLWFCDWAVGQVVAVDRDGRREVVLTVDFPAFPMSIDFTADGTLLVVGSAQSALLRVEPDGSLARQADLSPVARTPWNEIVPDARGNAYVNCIGFDFPGGEFAPGLVALVTPDGAVRQVADGVAFPNGMAIPADAQTLIVAESYGERLTAFEIDADGGLSGRRTWADTPGHHPDGICVDAAGAVWYADVGTNRCVSSTSPPSATRTRSCLTVAALPACSAGMTTRRCSSSPSGGARRRIRSPRPVTC
jgi:sugar lactone lactonase YvrE